MNKFSYDSIWLVDLNWMSLKYVEISLGMKFYWTIVELKKMEELWVKNNYMMTRNLNLYSYNPPRSRFIISIRIVWFHSFSRYFPVPSLFLQDISSKSTTKLKKRRSNWCGTSDNHIGAVLFLFFLFCFLFFCFVVLFSSISLHWRFLSRFRINFNQQFQSFSTNSSTHLRSF